MTIQHKRVHFQGFANGRPCTDAVSYVHYPGQQIVFTILRNGDQRPRLSTSDCIDSIVEAIAAEEGTDPDKLTFYELETHIGSPVSLKPGQYSFSQLIIIWDDQDIVDIHWRSGLCSDAVIEGFCGYITGNGNREKLQNVFAGSKNVLCPTKSPTYTLQDLYEIYFLIMGVEKKDGSNKDLCDHVTKRFTDDVIRTFCKENNTAVEDFDELMVEISHATALSASTAIAYDTFCNWLAEQDQEFHDGIHLPIFEEIPGT